MCESFPKNNYTRSKLRGFKTIGENVSLGNVTPNVSIGGPVRIFPRFPLQPEADPSEALWRKMHAGMTDLGSQIRFPLFHYSTIPVFILHIVDSSLRRSRRFRAH